MLPFRDPGNTLIRTSAVLKIIGGIVAVPLLAYISRFHTAPFSDNPAEWGQFGDFIGGCINPLLSLTTLIVTLWIAHRVESSEKERHEQASAFQLSPQCTIHGYNYLNKIRVTIQNVGLGHAKITKMHISRGNPEEQTAENLVALMPHPPEGIYWRNYTISGPPYVLREGSEIELICLEGDPKDVVFKNFSDEVRTALSKVTITISYTDVFGRKTFAPEARSLAQVFSGAHPKKVQ